MTINECIKIFDKNISTSSPMNQHILFDYNFELIDWIFCLFFITKNTNTIKILFSIERTSLILTENVMSLKSSFLVKFLSAFLIIAARWPARYKYLTKHHLNHSLTSIFWILIKPFLDGLIVSSIWYNGYNLRATDLQVVLQVDSNTPPISLSFTIDLNFEDD